MNNGSSLGFIYSSLNSDKNSSELREPKRATFSKLEWIDAFPYIAYAHPKFNGYKIIVINLAQGGKQVVIDLDEC